MSPFLKRVKTEWTKCKQLKTLHTCMLHKEENKIDVTNTKRYPQKYTMNKNTANCLQLHVPNQSGWSFVSRKKVRQNFKMWNVFTWYKCPYKSGPFTLLLLARNCKYLMVSESLETTSHTQLLMCYFGDARIFRIYTSLFWNTDKDFNCKFV